MAGGYVTKHEGALWAGLVQEQAVEAEVGADGVVAGAEPGQTGEASYVGERVSERPSQGDTGQDRSPSTCGASLSCARSERIRGKFGLKIRREPEGRHLSPTPRFGD